MGPLSPCNHRPRDGVRTYVRHSCGTQTAQRAAEYPSPQGHGAGPRRGVRLR
ncbi:hypothetical protein T261_2533 [Streptomyces lydicus]|nr:hypothetical protein T261_2533 [Streptomyces lydicus]